MFYPLFFDPMEVRQLAFKSADASISIPLPGFSADDLKAEVENDILYVRGDIEHPELGKREFSKSIYVGYLKDPSKVQVAMKDGVLSIKANQDQDTIPIEISS